VKPSRSVLPSMACRVNLPPGHSKSQAIRHQHTLSTSITTGSKPLSCTTNPRTIQSPVRRPPCTHYHSALAQLVARDVNLVILTPPPHYHSALAQLVARASRPCIPQCWRWQDAGQTQGRDALALDAFFALGLPAGLCEALCRTGPS